MRTKTGIQRLILLPALVFLAACSMSPEPQPTPVPGAMRKGFQFDSHKQPYHDHPWWQDFQDPNLTVLLADALRHAPDVESALANVQAFREQARIAGAPLLPTLDLNASGSRTKQNLRTFFPGGGSFKTNSFGLSLSASYELDLWGKLADTARSARLALLQSEASRDIVLQSIAATISDLYLQLAEARAELTARNAIERQAAALARSTKDGYLSGTLPMKTWLTASQALQSAHQLVSLAQTRVHTLILSINALAGRPLDTPVQTTEFKRLQTDLPPVPAGLPSKLLQRRPDVRSADLQVRMALLRVGIARSQLLPAIRLTGELGYKSNELSTLIDGGSSVWTLAGGIVQPLFNRGAKRAAVRQARHEAAVAVAAYRKTAMDAFREVETALVNEADLSRRLSAEERKLAESVAIRDREKRGYLSGSTLLSDYLNATIATVTNRINRDQLALQLMQNRIRLHTALGSGIARLHDLMESQGETK